MNSSPFYLLIAIIVGAVGMIGVSITPDATIDQAVSVKTESAGRVAGAIERIATIGVDRGDGTTYTFDQAIDLGTSALDLLQISMQRNFVTVQTKQFSFGTMVESIDGVANGTDNKYWVYYVNGESATVAADQFILQPGDLVEFKFVEAEI